MSATVTSAKVAMYGYERCDRCGAEAFVISQHGNGFLGWCAHHARQYHDQIAGHIIVDYRPKA